VSFLKDMILLITSLLKTNLFSETQDNATKFMFIWNAILRSQTQRSTRAGVKIRTDSTSEIEQQEIERALMTQARFLLSEFWEERNLERTKFRSRIEISDNYIGLVPARRCKNSGNVRCCHGARVLLDEQPWVIVEGRETSIQTGYTFVYHDWLSMTS